MAIFSKTVTSIFDLDLDRRPLTWYQQEGLVTRYTHVKYAGPNSYQSKDMANVKVFVDKQNYKRTDRQTDGLKTICPRSIDAGKNKSTACGFQRWAVGCLIQDKKSKSKKEHTSRKNAFQTSPLIVWTALWIVNTNSEFQVNIFSNNRDITKCQKKSKSKIGHNSQIKCILNCLLDSMDCSLDSEYTL